MHEKLIKLLALSKKIRESRDLKDFAFYAVNETFEVVEYHQAVFWIEKAGTVDLRAISGNQILDAQSTYAHGLKKIINDRSVPFRTKTISGKAEKSGNGPDIITLDRGELDEQFPQAAKEISSDNVTILFLKSWGGDILGGLWLEHDTIHDEQDRLLLQEMAEIYAFALEKFYAPNLLGSVKAHWKNKKLKIGLALAVVIMLLFPVRLSVTAPVEIIPQDPGVASVPYDGVVDTVLVDPGDQIEQGQIIAQMDKTALKARLANARESLNTIQSEFSGTRRLAMSNPDKKKELALLQAEIALKKVDLDKAREQMEKADIRAPRGGVAIFSSANEFKGKPMRIGERIMMIADPDQKLLQIRVPSQSMVPINKNIPVSFHMNVAPLKSYQANIENIGYQATPDPDGLLTYKIRAILNETDKDKLRLGWQGTGKVYGSWSVLSYAILRRPLIFLRKVTGI